MARQMRIPFGVDVNGAIAVETNAAAVDKMNLITLIGTQPGERAMRPTYGVSTRSLLFEDAGFGLAQSLASEIRSAISTYAPEVDVRDVQILSADEHAFNEGRIEVGVAYTPGAGRLATGVGLVATTVAIGG